MFDIDDTPLNIYMLATMQISYLEALISSCCNYSEKKKTLNLKEYISVTALL